MSEYENMENGGNATEKKPPSKAKRKSRVTPSLPLDDIQAFLKSSVSVEGAGTMASIVNRVEEQGTVYIVDYDDATLKGVLVSPTEYGRLIAKASK